MIDDLAHLLLERSNYDFKGSRTCHSLLLRHLTLTIEGGEGVQVRVVHT